MEIRIAEPIWDVDESGAAASLVERLEAQVEALTRQVGRLERRQQRFADMIRLLLALHDKTSARMNARGGEAMDDDEALGAAVGEIACVTTPSPRRSRRATAAGRHDG